MELTDKAIKVLTPPDTGQKIYWDTTIKGFGLRITQAGARSFILDYRASGKQRRITIGSYPDWNTKQARDQAAKLKRNVDTGADPMSERHTNRTAPTVKDLAERYLLHVGKYMRPRSLIECQS